MSNEAVDLYSIYFPLNLVTDNDIRKKNNHKIINTSNVINVFKKSNYITIIGNAGSGKSTLIKHLFINAIETDFAIPVLIELRYLNDYDGSFVNFIIQKSFKLEISENEKIFVEFMKKGHFVFFLDGYDELNTNRKRKIISEIDEFVSVYKKNNYIITSRPFSDLEQLNQFKNYFVKKLSFQDGEIEKFIFKLLQEEKELAEKVNESIELNINNNQYIEEFLVNPLLLTLYILTYQKNSKIPDRKFIFYRRVIDVLFAEHDTKTKLGYQHEITSELNHEQMEVVLRTFCILSFFNGHYDWDKEYMNNLFKTIKEKTNIEFDNNKILYDFKVATALWLEDNGLYCFAHRSLQEYFAASFVKHLNYGAKERIYRKVINHQARIGRRGGDYHNFLNLLREMDTMNFYKYYYLPLLDELWKTIDLSSDNNENIKSFIAFFISGYSSTGRYFSINKQVYKTIFIHIKYTQKLHTILFERAGLNRGLMDDRELKPFDEKFMDLLSPEVLQLINDLLKKYKSYIFDEMKKTNEYLKKSLKTDDEIVNLL